MDVKRALPFRRSRYLAPAAVLAAVAFGLFGVRYLVLGTLDLKASLVGTVYDNFFSTKPTEARNQLPKRANFDPQAGNQNKDTPSLEADRQPEDLLNSDESTDANNSGEDNSKSASQEGSQKEGDSASAGDKSKPDDSGKGKDAPDQNGKESNDNKSPSPNDGKQNGKSPSGQKNEGVLDKMKNALSDLADKIKQAAEGSKGQSTPPNSSGEKQQDAQKSDQSKEQQSQASANGEQQGQQGQDQQQSDAKSDQKASRAIQGSGFQERHRVAGRRKGDQAGRAASGHGEDQRDSGQTLGAVSAAK